MRLFFYGTLIDASDTPAARWLRLRMRSVARASVAGRLVAIPTPHGWFPALLPGRGRIHGVACDVDLSRRDLARLDRYEGREYRRVPARARLGSGTMTVELYRWRGAAPRGSRPIASGDFLNWLSRRRLRAYASPLQRW